MVGKILSFTLVLIMIVASGPQQAVAQANKPATNSSNDKGGGGTKKQIGTIIFAGIAGAILGLSTLSFYGRPQEKLSNIAVGFAFGVIIGAAYTTFKAASSPRDFYKGSQLLEEQEQLKKFSYQTNQPPRFNLSLHF